VETIEVTAAIIRRGDTLLIAQRPEGSHLEGLWEFPGGKREARETLKACLARECAEELGVTVRVGKLLRVIEHTYPERRVKLYFYDCRLVDGEPAAVDCQAVLWVRPEDLSNFRFPPADTALIEDLEAGRL
jgi:mutator protein MutT